MLRIHAEAHQWRLPGLSKQVREALGEPVRSHGFAVPAGDETEVRIRAVLDADGRASADAVAARSGVPATTVRRRLDALRAAGTLLTSVGADLHVVVWLRDLDALYEFITADLAGLDVGAAETTLVGRVVKRPGMRASA